MDLCCLGNCHPGYISPLTTKSLLKWGIDSSCRWGLQLGLAARWQGALKDQVLCWPHRVGGQQKSAQPALGVVSVELLVQGWACSSWQLPTASSALALAAVYPHACSLALVSSNPGARRSDRVKGSRDVVSFISLLLVSWVVREPCSLFPSSWSLWGNLQPSLLTKCVFEGERHSCVHNLAD